MIPYHPMPITAWIQMGPYSGRVILLLESTAETESIFRHAGVDWLSPAMLEGLYEKTRGWAAGLVLMAESARRAGRQVLPDPTPAEIFGYIAAEIFAKTDPARRRFSLRTAFMPALTASLAEQLTGEDHGRGGRLHLLPSQKTAWMSCCRAAPEFPSTL